jgi:hypothetical protein
MQAAAAEARSALAALLVAADGRRRCEFLEAVVAGVHAAALFFERGHEARALLCAAALWSSTRLCTHHSVCLQRAT